MSLAILPQSSNTSFGARITGRAWRELTRLIPQTDAGDKILTWLRFVTTFRRIPGKAQTFNDFLYDVKVGATLLDPLRSFTSDKEFLKLFVAGVAGDQFNVPTVAVLRTKDEARDFTYPARCVIKATHCSGATILRFSGEPIDLEQICRWFDVNYHSTSREKNYKYLTPKVIVEPFVFDDENPSDYKFFCVRGHAKMIQVDSDRHTKHSRSLFDTNWSSLPYAYRYPVGIRVPERPANLSKMIDLAGRLSQRFQFVRVDLYSDGRQAFVGELTHCPESVRGVFYPASGDTDVAKLLFDS